MSEEEFIKANNFETKDDFIKYLELDYKRNKYFQENVSTEEEVEKYYNEKVYGAINTEHILVRTSTSMSDEDASNLANEILDKLKNGTSWEDLKSEYSSRIITENVKVEFDSELEANYKTEAERLSENSYSTSLVKTSYGYHIIYKKSIEEKNSLEEVKSRIQSILATEKQEENERTENEIETNEKNNEPQETNTEKAPAMSYFEAMAKEYVKDDSKKLAELGSRLFRFKKAYESIDSKQNALKKKIEAIRYEI